MTRVAEVLLVATEHAGGGVEAWSLSGGARRLGKAELPHACALAVHPRLPLGYALTSQQSRIATVALDGPTLLEESAANDSLPCWAEVDESGTRLAVAHYDGDRVTVHRLAADGALGSTSTLVLPPGSGPESDRQDRPHPHQARFRGRDLWVSDLGADRLLRYRLAGGAPEVLPVRPGSGPRHFAWLGDDLIAVVDELSSSLSVYDVRPGELLERGSVALGGGAAPRNYPSDLAHARGVVYVANRGAGTISVVDVTGAPRLVQEVAVSAWPQNLVLGRGLWCAVRDDDRVVRLPIDDDARLGAAEPVLEVERPVWIEWC